MATPAKPASEKSVPAARSASESPGEDSPKPKKKKKGVIIGVAILALILAGGGGWYFTSRGPQTEEAKVKEEPSGPPKFVVLDPFTVNLQRETADQFLQIGITLKIVDPNLEERLKEVMPEIRSHLLILLSGKFPSELSSTEGKKKLTQEIIADINGVLGLGGKPKPVASVAPDAATEDATGDAANPATNEVEPAEPDTTTEAATASEEETPAADEATPAEAAGNEQNNGIVDVLFTSFIIQ